MIVPCETDSYRNYHQAALACLATSGDSWLAAYGMRDIVGMVRLYLDRRAVARCVVDRTRIKLYREGNLYVKETVNWTNDELVSRRAVLLPIDTARVHLRSHCDSYDELWCAVNDIWILLQQYPRESDRVCRTVLNIGCGTAIEPAHENAFEHAGIKYDCGKSVPVEFCSLRYGLELRLLDPGGIMISSSIDQHIAEGRIVRV